MGSVASKKRKLDLKNNAWGRKTPKAKPPSRKSAPTLNEPNVVPKEKQNEHVWDGLQQNDKYRKKTSEKTAIIETRDRNSKRPKSKSRGSVQSSEEKRADACWRIIESLAYGSASVDDDGGISSWARSLLD